MDAPRFQSVRFSPRSHSSPPAQSRRMERALLRSLAHFLQPQEHEGGLAPRFSRQLLAQFPALPLVQKFHRDRRSPSYDVRFFSLERAQTPPPRLSHFVPPEILHFPPQGNSRPSGGHASRPH